MNNSRQPLIRQAEKIIESYSKKKKSKITGMFYIFILSGILLSLITGFILVRIF